MVHIFTIGHSAHPIEKLLGILTENRIRCVVDVRTYPSSKHHPQYNRPSLDKALSEMNIEYRWAGANVYVSVCPEERTRGPPLAG